jgi:hypothetical protein
VWSRSAVSLCSWFICVLRRVGKLQLVGRCRYVVFMVLEKGFRDGGLKNEWFACIAFV